MLEKGFLYWKWKFFHQVLCYVFYLFIAHVTLSFNKVGKVGFVGMFIK